MRTTQEAFPNIDALWGPTGPAVLYRALAAAKGSTSRGGLRSDPFGRQPRTGRGDRPAGQEAGLTQVVLLPVNLEGESTKAGFLSDELDGAMPSLRALPHVAVKGLMAIPPPTSDPEQARPYFRRLRKLALRLSRQPIGTVSLKELSMGMSNDDHVAVEEGATMARVGRAIFGARRA